MCVCAYFIEGKKEMVPLHISFLETVRLIVAATSATATTKMIVKQKIFHACLCMNFKSKDKHSEMELNVAHGEDYYVSDRFFFIFSRSDNTKKIEGK